MTMKKQVVCEVVFSDSMTGRLTSIVGYVYERILEEFDDNDDEFILLNLFNFFVKEKINININLYKRTIMIDYKIPCFRDE